MTKAKRVAIYTRVSTDGQSVENQRRELLAVAERRGWEVVQEYSDHGISGAGGRDKRPSFDRMLKAATRREFDMIAAWSVDRLGRSLQHLVAFLGEIHAAGVDLFLLWRQLRRERLGASSADPRAQTPSTPDAVEQPPSADS